MLQRVLESLQRAPMRSILMSLATMSAVGLMPAASLAGAPVFDNITSKDLDNIVREGAAVTGVHFVTGASSLGKIFGVEAGVVAGVTQTPEINAIAKKNGATSEVSSLPHAGLLGGLSTPFGVTVEALYVPTVTISDLKYSQLAGALKFALADSIPLPLNLSVRAFYAQSSLSFSQSLNNSSTGSVPVNVTIEHSNTQYGAQLLASPNLPMIEPYAGIGYIAAKGKVGVSGSSAATIFSSAVTTGQSAESSPTSTQFLAGINVRLLLIVLGAEYSRAFDTDSYTAKLSLRF